MSTYNIIGDIHGRTNWKDLVEEDCINIYRGTDVIQIVGHSKVDTITETDNTIFVDCLDSVTQSKQIVCD